MYDNLSYNPIEVFRRIKKHFRIRHYLVSTLITSALVFIYYKKAYPILLFVTNGIINQEVIATNIVFFIQAVFIGLYFSYFLFGAINEINKINKKIKGKNENPN